MMKCKVTEGRMIIPRILLCNDGDYDVQSDGGRMTILRRNT